MAGSNDRSYLHTLKEAYGVFKNNHPIKFASAIAYFSLFALPCIFLVITFLLGLIYTRPIVYVELRQQLAKVIDTDGAGILITIAKNFEDKASESIWMTIMYVVVVFWLSTQFFRLFQNALNDLWRLKPHFDSKVKKFLMERGTAFLLVLSTGVVFFASLIVERGLKLITSGLFNERIMNTRFIDILASLFTAAMVFLWFALLYKVLPFVKIKWGPTFAGAAFTTVLFFAGVWLLWRGVVERDLEEFYEQVTSIILVALWMFYSSLIFLFGASFTRVYARRQDKRIAPSPHAYKYKLVRDDDFYHDNDEV